ncbi:MAG TPA: hypothetical protein VL122_06855 [Nitrospirota bacterium]|nr:hypothetical protein [Nitrospirota bacterium]
MAVPKKVNELIESSGNNFHAKVARWFSEKGWGVIVSPYYMDQSQNKAREIDLIAEKLWSVEDQSNRRADDVAVRLFIECKFVPSLSVFWFADKDQKSALKLVYSTKPFRPTHTRTKEHHYLSQSPSVAKLFSTNSSKAKAPENEPFYKALNQVLNATVSMRGQPVSVPPLNESNRAPKALIEFPVVVCNSFNQIYSVDFDSNSKPEMVTDNFQLEVRYAYIDRHGQQRDEYFLLDFVEFDQLEKFMEAINKDANLAVSFAPLTA